MVAVHAQDLVFNEADDDDGMPPLVDNPNPSMTFTFATDMTPITFSTDSNSFEFPPESVGGETIYSPPGSPVLGAARVSHAKKRDASYIPRPPNAFILFRSSFIRAQHIPGKIEGNHSALSKIIGKYWKALPREEREVWEAKAIVAQAEHRKRYPDWRFRPGANALAKVKDGPKRRSNRKGRGGAEKEERSREKRCAKIADLLVAGKMGSDLEAAVEEYDCAAGAALKVKEEGGTVPDVRVQEEINIPSATSVGTQVTLAEQPVDVCTRKIVDGTDVRSKTPDLSFDARFKVPLTAMFKRSSSAPAAHSRNYSGYSEEKMLLLIHNSDSCSLLEPPMAEMQYMNFLTSPAGKHEDGPRAGGFVSTTDDDSNTARVECVSATRHPVLDLYNAGGIPSPDEGAQHWNQAYVTSPNDSTCWSPLPAFEQDTDNISSPIRSPISGPFNLCDGDIPGGLGYAVAFDKGNFQSHDPNRSSYSSLKGWAGDAYSRWDSSPSWVSPLIVPAYTDAAIMRDAFEAATTAAYGDSQGHPGTDAAALDPSFYRWNDPNDCNGLHSYYQVLDLNCRLDNHPYFN